jgi:hypothetical protein
MKETQNNSRKKLAILLLAHQNQKQLKRLLLRLIHENIDVFIHLDKKWAIADNDKTELLKASSTKVFLCENRISGKLFEWSLVEATLELIKKAKQVEEEKKITYNYYALLSGQDYPIKPLDYILQLLHESYPKPFIDCTPYHPSNFLKKRFKSFPLENKILIYFLKNYKPDTLSKLMNRIQKAPFYALFYFLKLLVQTPHAKLQKLNIKLYGGSQWWILPDITINEIYKRYFINKDQIINIISKSFGPDETFFQIMTMQSKIAPFVEINDFNDIRQNCLTYAYFRDEGKPFTGHPYILRTENFDMLSKLPHIFARKFDDRIDSDILDLIDDNILNPSFSVNSNVLL